VYQPNGQKQVTGTEISNFLSKLGNELTKRNKKCQVCASGDRKSVLVKRVNLLLTPFNALVSIRIAGIHFFGSEDDFFGWEDDNDNDIDLEPQGMVQSECFWLRPSMEWDTLGFEERDSRIFAESFSYSVAIHHDPHRVRT
jgi:hypothetical protein